MQNAVCDKITMMMMMMLLRQEESLATDDDSAVLFDVSAHQNEDWHDDSQGLSSSLIEVDTRLFTVDSPSASP